MNPATWVDDVIFERGEKLAPAFVVSDAALEAIQDKLTFEEFSALEDAISQAVLLASGIAFTLGVEAMRNPAAWLLQPANSGANGQ